LPDHKGAQVNRLHIRSATVNDAAALAKVHVDSWRTTYAALVPADFLARLSYAQREQQWRQVCTDSSGVNFVYVAENACGTVVGFVSGGPERGRDPVYTGELYAIYLLAPYQGQGCGRQLVCTLVRRLAQAGMTTLLLWVLAENPARHFYERLGGHPVYEKTVDIGGVPLLEIAYGWRDVQALFAAAERLPCARHSADASGAD
jgi:GNAT superfamily N-acetyltransferase